MSNNQRWEPTVWDGSSRPCVIAQRPKSANNAAWLASLISMIGVVCLIGWGIDSLPTTSNPQQQEIQK